MRTEGVRRARSERHRLREMLEREAETERKR
jgi:hypothetical protein